MFSKEAAMAVTVAVETVISEHYNDQLRELHEEGLTEGDYEELRKVFKRDLELNSLP
jgi:demethoxyubiquinone hydroxylase (CLK1/Coq7/Cat5 family)